MNPNRQSKSLSFGAFLVEPLDEAYKIALQKGLKDSFGLTCKLEDLNPIAGPVELKKLLRTFSPRNFEIGPKVDDKLFFGQDTYQYAIDGSFRVNLHNHSNCSDGDATPAEFLKTCVAYANKVAKKFGHEENIPPFTASLTDHDRYYGCTYIIREISQNPDKYQNFKFVVGSEFYFDSKDKFMEKFEALGLGFNPFDSKLNETVTKTREPNQMSFIKTVKESGGILSLAHPLASRKDPINDKLFLFLKNNGIDGIEGNYQYFGFKYSKEFKQAINKIKILAQKYNMFLTGGTDSHSSPPVFVDDISDNILVRILND